EEAGTSEQGGGNRGENKKAAAEDKPGALPGGTVGVEVKAGEVSLSVKPDEIPVGLGEGGKGALGLGEVEAKSLGLEDLRPHLVELRSAGFQLELCLRLNATGCLRLSSRARIEAAVGFRVGLLLEAWGRRYDITSALVTCHPSPIELDALAAAACEFEPPPKTHQACYHGAGRGDGPNDRLPSATVINPDPNPDPRVPNPPGSPPPSAEKVTVLTAAYAPSPPMTTTKTPSMVIPSGGFEGFGGFSLMGTPPDTDEEDGADNKHQGNGCWTGATGATFDGEG
ncbi:unnamed protein product, partial [Discosporangium mesarthrocarpum]